MGEMLLNGRLYGASGIRELTQAQYDALPSSKLTDGILYCIKDTGIVEGDKYAPIIYSLEEREVGVWTDGKPIYQRTFPFNFSSIVSNWTLLDDTISYDEIVGVIARLNASNGDQIMSYQDRATDPRFCVKTDHKLYYYTTVTLQGVVTIQYTKTTDVAGSGTWGTNGVPMVHYDGTERIIGTWFGETLYEQTIEVNSISSGAEKSFAHGISNIDMVVDCKGFAYNGNDHKSFLAFIVPSDINSNTSSINGRYVFAISNADRTNIVCAIGSGIVSQLTKLVFTVQYTKTT